MRIVPATTLMLVLAAGGCSTAATVDADAESAAVAACEEYAAYVEANKAKESGTADILADARSSAETAADGDATYAPLAAGIESRFQAGEDLRAAVEGDASDGDAVDAAIELITSSNEAVAAACAPLGVDVDYAT